MQQMMQQVMRWANALFVRKRDLMNTVLSLLSGGRFDVILGGNLGVNGSAHLGGMLQLGGRGAEAVIVTTHPGNGSNQAIARIYQPSANTALMALIDLVMTKETSGGYAVKVEQHVMSVRVNASGNGTPAVTKTHNGTASSVNAGFYTIGDGTISGVVTEANNVDIRLAVSGSGNAVDHAIRVAARIRAISTNGQITNIVGL